jgi:hypothetical protein
MAYVQPAGSAAPLFGVVRSTLTRPANTTSYGPIALGSGVFVANSTTAGSVVFPSFTLPDQGVTRATILACNLTTNTTDLGWRTGGLNGRIVLFDAPPTAAVGDGASWTGAITVGSAHVIADYGFGTGGWWYSDTAEFFGDPLYGTFGAGLQLPVGTPIYWAFLLQNPSNNTGAVTCVNTSGQKFVLTLGFNQQ